MPMSGEGTIETSFRRADKTKEINEVIASWSQNSQYPFLHQFEGASGGKSYIIQNLSVSGGATSN